jgi:hypothetical protein
MRSERACSQCGLRLDAIENGVPIYFSRQAQMHEPPQYREEACTIACQPPPYSPWKIFRISNPLSMRHSRHQVLGALALALGLACCFVIGTIVSCCDRVVTELWLKCNHPANQSGKALGSVKRNAAVLYNRLVGQSHFIRTLEETLSGYVMILTRFQRNVTTLELHSHIIAKTTT